MIRAKRKENMITVHLSRFGCYLAAVALALLIGGCGEKPQPVSAEARPQAATSTGTVVMPKSILLPDMTPAIAPEIVRAGRALVDFENALADEQTSKIPEALDRFVGAATEFVDRQPAARRVQLAPTMDGIRQAAELGKRGAETGHADEMSSALLAIRDQHFQRLQKP